MAGRLRRYRLPDNIDRTRTRSTTWTGTYPALNNTARAIPGVKLSDRFDSLWQRCVARASQADDGAIAEIRPDKSLTHALYADLVTAYREPQRSYHTLEHIEHCLAQIDRAAASDTPVGDDVDLDLVELAIWYHDIIYVPQAQDNEFQSAELFRRVATGVLDADTIDAVYRLIMVTVHRSTPEQTDEAFMVDVDLSSFGMAWDDFHRDSVNVRSEMSHMSDEEFASGQGRFLQSLIDRDSIYGTPFFRERYEARARENIESYLEKL